jgi:hypothetical protein
MAGYIGVVEIVHSEVVVGGHFGEVANYQGSDLSLARVTPAHPPEWHMQCPLDGPEL